MALRDVLRTGRIRVAASVAAALVMVTAGSIIVMSVRDQASAHGTMQSPPSRVYHCRFHDLPQQPAIPACRDAIAIGGAQAVYDWNEISVPQAAGNHRAVIPDGRLCSAGRDKYRGFDQPRKDWPATRLVAGSTYDFRLNGSAAHKGTVDLFLTRDGYDPTGPLRWDDLEPSPFLRIREDHAGGDYAMTGRLPAGKNGRHLIYAVWQRSDSPEAFYACSDVVFGDEPPPRAPVVRPVKPRGDGPPEHDHSHPPNPTHSPDPTPSPKPTSGHRPPAAPAPTTVDSRPAAAAWQPHTSYAAGAVVSFEGRRYTARQSHTSQPGWAPPEVPALWIGVPAPDADKAAQWQPQINYPAGARVSWGANEYVCVLGHESQRGWEPTAATTLWRLAS
ncbi:hypothetical protein GCM10022251_75800 [Phytohabitans flavus]|uniref:Chitin-binding type-3 domain-containing protein n=1 Tax=Phytohabitans flavus TaxID=1076124 RepID=A0A6F8XMH7_9ACTN|nr:lytic polysaccharide monooxygenase [Phytohabitans flavus]BCB75015.1 hypothetical protein Pflav_014250 [Phytohabitans flavus]